MNLKKGLIVGVGALMLLGGVSKIQSVSAAENQPAKVEAKAGHAGKRLEVLSQFKDQIHQVNQLREDRLDLKKQMIEKRDQLLDLVVAAKQSGNKEDMKQAKEVKQQLKSLNSDMKTLIQEGRDERKALKEALKNGEGSEQFDKLTATQQKINEKMKEKLAELDKMIEILK
ncbi:hypothetical protein ACIFOT_27075 [Neobacillus sp. NRS-1170]|uniref:hypothetical protein n=1 Tax=Neobacillus sp. NRS-1170 TaxID=3233898 RepID=UPI003D2C6A75